MTGDSTRITTRHMAGLDITAGSPERFGYEWSNYAEMLPEYEEQFRGWTPSMQPEEWRGVSFVDAGCGMGRNSYWPMRYGAARGLSIDVDHRSLDSARRTLAPYPDATVRELSIYDLEASGDYDVVFSIGVIHHLEHPDAALRAMTAAAKPGGRVLIWVYGLENNRWIVYLLTPIRKLLLSRLPPGLVHHASLYPSALLWTLLHLGCGRIQYFRLLRRLSFRHLRSIVFDQMLPKIAHYWSKTEVHQLMQRAGLADIQLNWVNEMSWAADGRRPEAADSTKQS
jgi:2-polyprenyl-3-methyl-5-hydroxy-6-metoxy-1,4-benzoquinol methylase